MPHTVTECVHIIADQYPAGTLVGRRARALLKKIERPAPRAELRRLLDLVRDWHNAEVIGAMEDYLATGEIPHARLRGDFCSAGRK